ncbi:hypothetical protein JTE90_011066 [Oedothorax gibbosus]|uniref:FYVE-type domain-containing protein n=1 Tax=Oedothorax gibbosus TaxID=931172 RepID=A0AAV6VEN6_9ARAC|nr:hypothetical protein JTE90_011066 [Oedothorax gibbosus]
MEKYTFDIDKVLDEFEETEALKVNSDQSSQNCVDHHLTPKSTNNPEEKSSEKLLVGKAFDTNKSPADIPKPLPDIKSISEINNISSKGNVTLDNEHSSQCSLDNETNYSNSNKEGTTLSLNQVDVLHDDVNAKHLSYDIFYKPREPGIGLSVNHLQPLNSMSELYSDEFGLGDYSQDEILCVSVEENKPELSMDESQRQINESRSAYNSIQSNDLVSKDLQLNTECFTDSLNSSIKEELLLDIQTSEEISTSNSLADFDDLTAANKANSKQICRPNQLSLNTVLLRDSLMDEDVPQSENQACLSPPLDFYSQAIEDNKANELIAQNMKLQYPDSQSIEVCSNQIAYDEDNTVMCNSSLANNYVEDVQINNEPVVDVFAPEIPRNALDLQNGFNVQDDDSGVSSTEDISGNSPPQLNSGPDNSVVNENCDIGMTFSSAEQCDEGNTFPDITNHKNSLEDSKVCLSTSVEEITQDLNCISKESTSIKANINGILTIEKEVIASETEHSNQNICGYDLNASDSINATNNSIVDVTINGNALQSISDSITDFYEPESSIKQSSTSQMEPDFVDTQNFNVSEEKESISENDTEQNLMDSETIECTEDLNLMETNDCISTRLQRPTTLNLPSLVIASPCSIDETSAPISSDGHAVSENVYVTTATEPISAEMNTSVKPRAQIGTVKPYWIPDAEAINCMHCAIKFTVIKRRHHCRGCGKVLCSRCCNQKAFLTYLNKEDRICQPCADVLTSTLQIDQIPVPSDAQSPSSCGSSPNFSPSPQNAAPNYADRSMWRPHPNNPDDYCSTIPPLQQIQASESRPPPTVMVPIGVLKRGNKPRKEPKQVIFSDGIRPGGDLTDLTEPAENAPVYRRFNRKRVDKLNPGDSNLGTCSLSPVAPYSKNRHKRIIVSDEEGPLPPIILKIDGDTDEKMDWNKIFERIQDDNQKSVNFALMKNMHLFVKITTLDCCFGNECWCFTSHGLCTVGQDEVMVVMEKLPEEKAIPRDIFKLFSHVYDSASKGSTFDDLGHIIFPEQILGSNDHRGFLFVRPTFQCLSKLTVPNTPYLVAILIHKWEVPWAKVFPIRLMLRLGAECRYYPCSLVSIRHRKPVYFEIGQTIMSVLADLRNFQFTIPVIAGLVVHMEEKKTCVNIPRNRYEKVIKILNNNNVEHVLALGSNFSTEADSHLVCMQKEEGDYQTQAINIENTTRKVTGASFIIFSGALKSASGLSAKFSIVEDGLLIQISQDTMVALHMALRDMKDLTIPCGQINAEPDETVMLQWTKDDKKFNIGVVSPIDDKCLEGIPNLRIHSATDYASENYLIRWTEVFFLDVDENSRSIQNELVDPCRLAETVAQSCCMALTPYLDQLAESELKKLGLRVTLDSQSDRVEYDIGARGKPLPSLYMNALDSGLIPVILRLSSSTHSEKLSFELIFHILIK